MVDIVSPSKAAHLLNHLSVPIVQNQIYKGLLETSVFVGKWVGTRFSANARFVPEGRDYTTCTVSEGPYVYFGRRALTLCRPDVHQASKGLRPRRRLVFSLHFLETDDNSCL